MATWKCGLHWFRLAAGKRLKHQVKLRCKLATSRTVQLYAVLAGLCTAYSLDGKDSANHYPWTFLAESSSLECHPNFLITSSSSTRQLVSASRSKAEGAFASSVFVFGVSMTNKTHSTGKQHWTVVYHRMQDTWYLKDCGQQ